MNKPLLFVLIMCLLLSCILRSHIKENIGTIKLSGDDARFTCEFSECQSGFYEKSCLVLGNEDVNGSTPIIMEKNNNYVFTFSGQHFIPDEYDVDVLALDLVVEIKTDSLPMLDTLKIPLITCNTYLDYVTSNIPFEDGFGNNLEGEIVLYKKNAKRICGQILLDGLVRNNILQSAGRTEEYCFFSGKIAFVAKRMKTPKNGKVIMYIPKYYQMD